MAKRCRQLSIILLVAVWFIIAEGGFGQLVHAELLQEQSEENDYAEDIDEALSVVLIYLIWSSLYLSNLSKTHIGFGELC